VDINISTNTKIDNIIESLPKEITAHMQRVGMLVDTLTGLLMQSDFCQKDCIRNEYTLYGKAASYHDIGKVWVPRKILTKSDKLTEKEAVQVYKHPEFAQIFFSQGFGDSITMSDPFIKLAFNSAVYHHEWWNGKGYPYQLASEAIPLIARITSICDAYDAMTNTRSYRKANTHFHACRELEANAGTQFDPLLVELFLDNQKKLSDRYTNHSASDLYSAV
jgi:putative two-component system response regulator